MDGAVRNCSVMDDETAQVTPKELTVKLMKAALARGARVLKGVAQVNSTPFNTQRNHIAFILAMH